MLPAELSLAIAELNAEIPRADLARAVHELSSQYRAKDKNRLQLTNAHRAAYLTARLPATYAVISRVLQEAQLRIPGIQIESLLDLGAGPGTVMWAATERFPSLERVKLIEDSGAWIEMGKRMAAKSENAAIRSAEWQQGSITADVGLPAFDLVALSYVVNEVPLRDRPGVLLRAWERTNKLFVILEPGTPEGFANIRSVRDELISERAFLVAPCPHANQCPIETGDWCHFAERLERTSEHRRVKRAELGYEDEKYSYVVFARDPIALPAARILRHPRKHSGHVELELCTQEGLKRETIARRHGDRYKRAKKAEWGETL